MNTLTYYKQYRSLSDRASMLEGQLQFFSDDYNRSETLKELHRIFNLKEIWKTIFPTPFLQSITTGHWKSGNFFFTATLRGSRCSKWRN